MTQAEQLPHLRVSDRSDASEQTGRNKSIGVNRTRDRDPHWQSFTAAVLSPSLPPSLPNTYSVRTRTGM
jgi:UDP-N-acetylmuramoylalanine-D-glutamate ligase